MLGDSEHTFNVDIANGDYAVTVTIGDQSYGRDLIDLYLEGVQKIDDLTVGAGIFQEITLYTTVTDGQLNLSILDDGGAPYWVITALDIQPGSAPSLPTSAAFDFGTSGSPVASGYTQVTESTLYSVGTGYGWTSTSGLISRDRTTPDDLKRDVVLGDSEHTFNVDIANGDYAVTVTIGDQSYGRDLIDLYLEGVQKIDDLTVGAGIFQEITLYTTVTDGQLNLSILDDGGAPYWVITALDISQSD